jgi:DivIVA domain-containing protein
MTEDSFNLTPLDVRTQQFGRTLRGYDQAAVEEFRERVASELERLLREKAVADEQVRNFREQLKSFRERENALSEALVGAEQLRDDTEQHAQRKAESILREAQIEAEANLNDARQAEQAVLRDIEAAQRQLASYLASFRVLLERNLAEVEAAEERERAGADPGRSSDLLRRPSKTQPPVRLVDRRPSRPANEE